MAAVRAVLGAVEMQMFSAGGASVYECVCTDPESAVFEEAAEANILMFVYAGRWPKPIITTAFTGGMLPWCVCVCACVKLKAFCE